MNIDMIRAAAGRLEGHARRTPLLSSPFLDAAAGRRVWVKPECLQRTGSFKFRGAWAALSALDPEVRARGVIAFSSGNHAQGVARAAAEFDVPSVIIMPNDAPQLKIDNTRALGAEVILYDRPNGESREALGDQIQAERGMTLIKPYDEVQVIAGQGTCGLEIAEQARDIGITNADVLVCCGGGGLTSGIALALEKHAPGLKRIIDATAKRANLSADKVMVNIMRYGNTTSATIPLCLWEWEDKLEKGDNLLLAAFGGGFAWGSIYLKWSYGEK